MAIWIQSLSWALICSLAQGFVVYAALRLILWAAPARPANARYNMSLVALTILLVWFVATWSQQFHALSLAGTQLPLVPLAGYTTLQLLPQHTGYGLYRTIYSLQAFFPWLSMLYVTGFVIMLSRLSLGIRQLFSLRTLGTFPPAAHLDELIYKCKRQLGMERPVTLLLSATARVPMVIGFLKPVILVPVSALAQLDAYQLETVLLHELAHIRRHDYLVNILQTIVETVMFFNPFVWAISAIVRQEREHSCDELVVNNTPHAIPYAAALAVLATHQSSTPRIAIAATGQQTKLFHRIQRIIEMKKDRFNYSRMVAAIILIVTITCSIAWVRPTFPKVKKAKPSSSVTVKADSSLTKMTATAASEETILIGRLLTDHLVDQVKGFVVERNNNNLYINGAQLRDEVATRRYLRDLKKTEMRVQVFSMDERMRMHPDASFIQLLLPATFSSPCIDTRNTKKEGC